MTGVSDRQETSKAGVILLLALFMPYIFGFLAGIDIGESGIVSFDKIFRVGAIYVFSILLFIRLRNSSLPRGLGVYFWPAAILFMILFLHYVYSSADQFNDFRAKKELYRLSALIVLFMLCAAYSFKPADHHFLVSGLVAVGAIVGGLSIWHSATGEVERLTPYVGEYLRAGTSITDANSLGALLNVTSMAAIAGYLTAVRRKDRIWFLCSFIIMQVARFFTFSNGSFYSMIISLIAGFYLLGKYGRQHFRRYSAFVLSGVMLITVLIVATGLFDTLFYRIKLSDEFVRRASVESRVEQHLSFLELMKAEPLRILTGYGTAGLPEKLGFGLDLHNSYLRPMGVAGIAGFLSFALLCFLCLRNFIFAATADKGELSTVAILFLAAFLGWSFQAATLPEDTSLMQWFFFITGYVLWRSASYEADYSRRVVT